MDQNQDEAQSGGKNTQGEELMEKAGLRTTPASAPSNVAEPESAQEKMTTQIIENEFRISVLELLLEKIVSKNPGLLTNNDIASCQEQAVNTLQEKYPNSGVALT
jgi:hypothetical protein